MEDPLRPGNHVVTFTALTGAGDMFSPPIGVAPGPNYLLQFEYLGQLGRGTPGDLGGFIGFAEGTPDGHRWLDGTTSGASEHDSLVDDGQWHFYSIQFDPFDPTIPGQRTHGRPLFPSKNTIRLMLEDFDEAAANVPGDAYFDNIVLISTPEPSPLALIGSCLCCLLACGVWNNRVHRTTNGRVSNVRFSGEPLHSD